MTSLLHAGSGRLSAYADGADRKAISYQFLTAQEFADLEAGADPLTNTGWTSGTKPAGLVAFMPMAVDAVDAVGNSTTVTCAVLIPSSTNATAPGGTGTSTGSGSGGAAVGNAGGATSASGGTGTSTGSGSGGAVVGGSTAPVIQGGYERSSINLAASSVSGSGDSAVISIAPKVQESEVTNSETRWLEPSARIVGVNGFRPTFKFLNYAATAVAGTYHGAPWQSTRRPMFSYDRVTWNYFDTCTVGSSDITFRHNTAFTSNTVYISRSRQLTVTQIGQWIESLVTAHPTTISPTPTAAAFTPTLTSWPAQNFIADEYSAQTDSLGVAIPATPFYAVRISDPALSPAAGGSKRRVVIWGGVHAGEDHAEYVMMRVIEHLLGSSTNALRLRAEYDIDLYPSWNSPGRVGGGWRGSFTQGTGGADDTNRHFSDASPGFEIVTKPRAVILADLGSVIPDIAAGFHGTFEQNWGFFDVVGSPYRSLLRSRLANNSGFTISDGADSAAGSVPTWFYNMGVKLAVDLEHGDVTPVSDAQLATYGAAIISTFVDFINAGNLFVVAQGGTGASLLVTV